MKDGYIEINQKTNMLSLGKLVEEKEYEMQISDSLAWVHDLAKELTQDQLTDAKSVEASFEGSIVIQKKKVKKYGKTVFLDLDIKCSYKTTCVRCLVPTDKSLRLRNHVASLDLQFESEEEFEEVSEVYLNGKVKETFFHENSKLDLAQMIRECLYPKLDGYPLHDENCLGLCSQCGANLNTETCSHQQKK